MEQDKKFKGDDIVPNPEMVAGQEGKAEGQKLNLASLVGSLMKGASPTQAQELSPLAVQAQLISLLPQLSAMLKKNPKGDPDAYNKVMAIVPSLLAELSRTDEQSKARLARVLAMQPRLVTALEDSDTEALEQLKKEIMEIFPVLQEVFNSKQDQ